MSGNTTSEIVRLKQHIFDSENMHKATLSTWTTRCGQMGNEIGRLKQQLSENENIHQTTLSAWTTKCGQMGNEIGRLKQQLSEKEQTPSTVWTTRCGQMGNDVGRLKQQLIEKDNEHEASINTWTTKCEQMATEIDRLKQQVLENDSANQINVSTSTTECEKMGNEIGHLKQQISEMLCEKSKCRCEVLTLELSNVISTLKNLVQEMNAGIVELKATVKTNQKPENTVDSELDGENAESSTGTNTLKGSEQSLNLSTMQLQDDEIAVKQKSHSFWNGIKSRVTKKNQHGKSNSQE